MTTTVFDTAKKTVTSDSRWSVNLTNLGFTDHIWYVDDTGFDKIAENKTHILVLAGDAYLIAQWKKWWADGLPSDSVPPVELSKERTISLSIINKYISKIEFDCGHKLAQVCTATQDVLAVFSGSGSIFAAAEWQRYLCPHLALEFAKENDHFSGGETKYVDYDTDKNNLGDHIYDYNTINTELLGRGWIMNIAQVTTPISINDLAAPDADTLKSAMSAGTLNASAPISGYNTFVWTEREKERLAAVLQSVREAETSQ